MARDETPPFARGETFYNGSAIDPVFTDPLNYLGKEYVFEVNSVDSTQGYPTNQDTSGRSIRVRIVQNKSGAALLPKRVVKYKKATPIKTQVDGYVFAATDIVAGVVDEFLPAAGVAANDLFYLVVEGPSICKTESAGSVSLAVGDRLYAAAGTGALTADSGGVAKYTTPTVAQIVQFVGYAETVATTNSADLPVCVHLTH